MRDFSELTVMLEQEFDLPAGQYFEVTNPAENVCRIAILEEAGGCTVQDWRIDGIDISYPVPESIEFDTKTAVLRDAAKSAAAYLNAL